MTDDNAFEREKLCYQHNTAQMRALNEQMTRVPPIAITLTGGLWFAASQGSVDPVIKFGLLLFAGIANVGLGFSCFRIRDVMKSYLEKIEEFDPAYFANGRPKKPLLPWFVDYSMITIYVSLMGAAALLSIGGALTTFWPFEQSRWFALIAAGAVCIALPLLQSLLKRRSSARDA